MHKKHYTDEEAQRLEQAWMEQVRTQQFSPAVVGVGEFRLFGKTGDTPGTYPQIRDLDCLATLTEAERYALQMIDVAANSALAQEQALVAVVPGSQPRPEGRLTTFDPTKPCIFAIPRVIGG